MSCIWIGIWHFSAWPVLKPTVLEWSGMDIYIKAANHPAFIISTLHCWAPIRAKQLSSIFVGWLLRIGLSSVLLTLSSWPKEFPVITVIYHFSLTVGHSAQFPILLFTCSGNEWTAWGDSHYILEAAQLNLSLPFIWAVWFCMCVADVTCFHVWMLWACKCRTAEQMHAILLTWDCAVSASFSGWSYIVPCSCANIVYCIVPSAWHIKVCLWSKLQDLFF